MDFRKIIMLISALVLLVALASCSPQGNSTTNPSNQPTTAAVDCSTVPTPSIDVAALITEKLQNHHDNERIYNAQHTREEWNATLDRMISYGASISEEEKQIIIDYLLCGQK
jgi:hypothetical protein